MVTILLSPFFLLFCATSAATAYLAHRFFVEKARPAFGDQCLTLIAGLQCLSLAFATYQIRNGCYASGRIDPGAATLVTGLTGLGVAVVAIECLWAGGEPAE